VYVKSCNLLIIRAVLHVDAIFLHTQLFKQSQHTECHFTCCFSIVHLSSANILLQKVLLLCRVINSTLRNSANIRFSHSCNLFYVHLFSVFTSLVSYFDRHPCISGGHFHFSSLSSFRLKSTWECIHKWTCKIRNTALLFH